MVITQFDVYQNISFYTHAHNSGPKGSPDMILNAFNMKFDDKIKELPPKACRPQNKIPTIHNKKQQQKCTGKWIPRPPGGRSPPGCGVSGGQRFGYIYIRMYKWILDAPITGWWDAPIKAWWSAWAQTHVALVNRTLLKAASPVDAFSVQKLFFWQNMKLW